MKRSVSKETQQSIAAGAILGAVLLITGATAPVVYVATIVVGTMLCLADEGRLRRIVLWRRGRRR